MREAGGAVWLASRLGQGGCVTVQLPMTMAVTRIVAVEARGRPYGVAMVAVADPRAEARRLEAINLPCRLAAIVSKKTATCRIAGRL